MSCTNCDPTSIFLQASQTGGRMGKAHPAVARFPLSIPAPTMEAASLLMTLAWNKLQLSLAFKLLLAFWVL